MWVLLTLLCLAPWSSAVPFDMFQALAVARTNSSHRLQASSTSLVPPTVLPPHSEAPALSLNLGLNFKIKLRSQGKGRLDEGPVEASVRPRLPPTHFQALGNHFWPEGLGGSGWLGTGPADELPSGPGRWGWDRSPAQADPTPHHPNTLWPRLTERGLVWPTSGNSKELEFKIDIDLTAGLGQEGELASNSSSSSTASRRYSLFPGLRVGISKIVSKPSAPGLFGATLPPEKREPPLEQNVTDHSRERPEGSHSTPAQALQPGPESSSEEAFTALPGCLPHRPEDCGSPSLCVPPPADWAAAQAAWGTAWGVQLYGAAALFVLLTLLALLALLRLLCRCPPRHRLLALLLLLLAAAGGTRAALLFEDAWGRPWLLPPRAARLLLDLPLPCLTSALAIALLLLLRARPAPSRTRCLPPPLLLLLLPLLHFSVAASTALVAAPPPPPQLPILLLASRGTFALLAALLATLFLAAPTGPSATARHWSRAAPPAATCGLLSAGLHAYAILHALGLGLPAELFGPWAWWALQLAGRLCEVGVGLPLAWLGLAAALGPLPQRAAAKDPLLPEPLQWAFMQPEKAERLQELHFSPATPDPTADFLPPSPIDLRRSIDEALGGSGEGLFAATSVPSATSVLSLATQPWPEGELSCATSCAPLSPARSGSPPTSPLPAASQESLASAGRQAAEAAQLRQEFLAVCRQIDALSVSSDTIEL